MLVSALSCTILFLIQIYFLLNCGKEVQGDFLKCMSLLFFATPILPNLLSSMTSFKIRGKN